MILLCTVNTCFAVDALVDLWHSQALPQSSSPFFDEARAALVNAGHSLTPLLEPTASWIPGGYDLYVTGTLNTGYTSAEINAMQNYVAGGGSVLVIHDGGYDSDDATPSMNSFLAPYGIVLSATSSYEGLLVEGFADHCLTRSVASLGLVYVRLIASIAPPAEDLTTGTYDFLAYYENGSGGQVIVLTDDSLWTDGDILSAYHFSDLDNQTMLLNIFDCIEAPVATEMKSWGVIKGFYD